jgi:hypothetical protein
MLSEQSAGFAGLKGSQLPKPSRRTEGFAYYCRLCDEVLVVSRHMINPRKVTLIFNGVCPGCGFPLQSVLENETSWMPKGRRILVNPKCTDGRYLVSQTSRGEFKTTRGDILLAEQKPTLTTGIAALDRALILRFGQLVALQGTMSHSLSSLLCVRTALPKPEGHDSEVVFLDGGNSFDTYLISEHSISHERNSQKILERIHLSRAFTYHQLSRLIHEKLPYALDHFKARLAVVSDITHLYCDPDAQTDMRKKQEALNVFRRDVRSLSTLAEQKSVLILATDLQTRNRPMENALLRAAHVSARLDDKNTFTKLTLAKHPFTPQLKTIIPVNKQTLESYT